MNSKPAGLLQASHKVSALLQMQDLEAPQPTMLTAMADFVGNAQHIWGAFAGQL